MPPAVQFFNLDFSYPDKTDVLRDISLSISPGERVGLIGPNGAGKTTLFLLACGLLKPTSGEIRLLGQPVVKGGFNPDIALVFQRSDDQLFCPTVGEDVAFGPENQGLTSREVDLRVQEALTAVGGQHLSARPVHHLSEGEKRLVAIAGALALRPRIVIFDEPSAGLDIRGRRRLIPLLQQSAPTVLIASHDLELILETCTRVLLMDMGQIIADGLPRDIMSDEVLMTAHGQEKPHSLVPHQVAHRHTAA
ncbi:energy-coupling factor ABC transporter ATP-binding protein [Desulfobulbus alkaliphilus]|uniref:energy-coupling factor ABC transporter ATP-binding protein n=1 Tax=Desulfobulbus alkaliphilus TaxID=869814 RepID=UPI001F06EB54|nr:ABC transporter ATP-binding protein [Desulfobulbus alkaliphilus]